MKNIVSLIVVISLWSGQIFGQSLSKRSNRVRQASDFATSGDGSSTSPWRGWEPAIETAADGTTVYFSNGTYASDSGLKINGNSISLVGAPARGSVIVATGNMSSVITSEATDGRVLSIQQLSIDANGKALHGISLSRISFFDSPVLESVLVRKATQTGIVLSACQLCQIRGVTSTQNDGAGFEFAGDNGSVATAISATFNRGSGIVVRSSSVASVTYSGGMTFFTIDVEHNGGGGS